MPGVVGNLTNGITAVELSPEDIMGTLGGAAPTDSAEQGAISDEIRSVVASALDAIAQSGSADQLRGYANEAIGETKLNLGLAVGSTELTLLGIAQKALGQAQRYIGEAKGAIEADISSDASFQTVLKPLDDKATSLPRAITDFE